MKFFPLFIFFMACNPAMWNAVEDGIVGEVKVAETVMSDLTGSATQQAPDIKVPIKKF